MSESFAVLNSIPRKREGLEVREVDGETMILDRENCWMHSLNPPAAFIYSAIDGLRTADQIAQDLATSFGVPFERASVDTRRLLEQLGSLQLLV